MQLYTSMWNVKWRYVKTKEFDSTKRWRSRNHLGHSNSVDRVFDWLHGDLLTVGAKGNLLDCFTDQLVRSRECRFMNTSYFHVFRRNSDRISSRFIRHRTRSEEPESVMQHSEECLPDPLTILNSRTLSENCGSQLLRHQERKRFPVWIKQTIQREISVTCID